LMTAHPAKTTDLIKRLCTTEDWTCESGNDEHLPLRGTPEEFVHIFVDHPAELRDFLQSVVDATTKPNAKREDLAGATPLVWNTLLELTLALEYAPAVKRNKRKESTGHAPDEGSVTLAEEHVMEILTHQHAKYDPDHALVLVQAHGFKRGQLELYEKLEMYHMLLRHYMEAGNEGGSSIIEKCKAWAGRDPNLWMQVLMHFAQRFGSSNDIEEQKKEIDQVLRLCGLSPLLVVQILSSNAGMTLSAVRSYILSQLESSQQLIEEDKREIKQLREDTARMREEIKALKTKPKIFKSTKCELTGAALDLPTVHFMSGNSYNMSSLSGKLEDPKCSSDQQSVFEIMQGLEQRNIHGVHEEFFHELEYSADGFETIAEYFGKCLFKKVSGPKEEWAARSPHSLGAKRRLPSDGSAF